MIRRLDIAMTLMGRPRLIFLDEPTTGLDPRSRRTMWGIVRELAAGGVTILLTTQYLRTLQERAEQLRQTRERIAALRGGDRLFVSAELADYLDRLLEIGVSRRGVQMERDLWILAQSVSPVAAAAWIADKVEALEDPEFQALYRDTDAAFDWSPDDPRLTALAERTRRWVVDRDKHSGEPGDPALARLISASTGGVSPAWDRLAEITNERAVPG